jgi:1,2-dihydroxy-3-keto-5-methylthiopentene dioxygenase
MKVFFLLCMTVVAFAADKLRVYDDTFPELLLLRSSEYAEIAPVLSDVGIRFEKWEANQILPVGASEAEVFEAYKKDIDRLNREGGYKTVDIVRMHPDSPKKVELRNKFLNEHTHTEDEVRFFVEGSGLFYLHISNRVYVVLCEKGDLISIPAYYPHWFDMGTAPQFTAIRFFCDPSGWVANFTDSPISQNYPKFDDK